MFQPAKKKSLLREAHRRSGPTLLFCAKTAFLPSRILLIDQGDPFADQLSRITLELCEIFRAGLVVLTVARTEREACQRQRRARETLEGSPVHVNFDFLAGADVRSAAASVARWRRCQLVVLEANSAWERWLGFHSGSWITERLESLSFLVFPAAPVPEMLPRQPSRTSPQERGEHLARAARRNLSSRAKPAAAPGVSEILKRVSGESVSDEW
jgi:PAS domain-containing protein